MDASQENQNNAANVDSGAQLETITEPVQESIENKGNQAEGKNENSKTDDDYNDDSLDDICVIDAATSILDETFSIDDPDLVIPDHINDAYKDIMIVCSTTAQNIRKTISEVLSSREGVVITEVDPAAELEESLNKKIADFEKIVSGSFESDEKAEANSGNSIQDNNNIEIVSEENKDPANVDVNSTEINAEKSSDISTESTKVTADVSNNVTVKTDLKDSVSDDKKKEIIPEALPNNTKSIPATQNQSSDSLREMLKNISIEEEKVSKKQKNVNSKKKGEKTIDQILKSLGNGTAEEKLHLLCKKHLEVTEELRLLDPRFKQLERQIITQQREKEQLQAENNRLILAKSRLEGLCRELQRQSKAIKEESLLRIKAEEEKRKEIANKFQSTLNDISALMQENSKKNVTLRQENAELATKLKSLVDNYEVWEQHMSKIVQQKELETQLAKAKHAKVNLLLKQETEKFLREKQALLENLSELQKRCTLLTTNELQLRTELGDYTSKYEEFQNVLSNSSKVFATFKNDMESTSKKIKKLEKETNVYKQKWESSNNALLEMINHKEKQDKEFANAQQRIATLEKLCRALQAERNELRNQLNTQNANSESATTPDVPSLTPETGVA
ncbi:alpha-taxilin-like [Argiope bruennichi]|uniref:Alpha-taxilin like protein n=1 Tax=Argiope bruennichi TaxID=94029 RepID=A0A8T0EST2_ARGBR|nr:alpha-taxilin-like [Argiope bruennichi]XP_055943936.1 alpha-taxilin-like [Argiope bruennichi]XP_055943937.1 alpha-taxilin-like [Argiope bruennichi]KAF8778807.1 Alpha-taxilin like protein [Argiope bruennichi]